MKTNCKLALAVLAGVLISIAGARLIHAQQVKMPPAYVIAEVEVTDPVTLKKYSEKAPQIVASFDGHYVVRGGKIQALEGEAPKGFIVVIGFDSVATARGGTIARTMRSSGRSGKAQPRAAYPSRKAPSVKYHWSSG